MVVTAFQTKFVILLAPHSCKPPAPTLLLCWHCVPPAELTGSHNTLQQLWPSPLGCATAPFQCCCSARKYQDLHFLTAFSWTSSRAVIQSRLCQCNRQSVARSSYTSCSLPSSAWELPGNWLPRSCWSESARLSKPATWWKWSWGCNLFFCLSYSSSKWDRGTLLTDRDFCLPHLIHWVLCAQPT